MTRAAALSAYKSALRATKTAFGGDLEVLHAARTQIRAGFGEPVESEAQAVERIEHLNGVASILNQNIVQGRKKENDERYMLNIHSKTELGDNETIKTKKSEMGSLAGAKATKRCS